MNLFFVVCAKVGFGFVQVLLILRSQVGPMHCARFILWSEVRCLASAIGIFVLTLFPYFFLLYRSFSSEAPQYGF